MSTFLRMDRSLFLQDYWQQQPLWVRNALPEYINSIDGDDLAGLACEAQVESRIISGVGLNGEWHCQQGPFDEQVFASLPAKHWTLLVQGLDQWDDGLRSLLNRFSWLSRWRLEDIMASVAPLGGGVGPHFDYYDVFLIQVSGTREWQLGQVCDESSPLQDNDEVKLLEIFNCDHTYSVEPGDLLYIPAGVAHWGTASSDHCITLSVGFRAPSEKELITVALENLVEQCSENKRYRDSVDTIDNHPYRINANAHKQLTSLCGQITSTHIQRAIEHAFGQLVTEPRYEAIGDEGSSWNADQLRQRFSQHPQLDITHPPHTRCAFDHQSLFVNGNCYCIGEAFAQSICDGVVVAPLSVEQTQVLVTLLNNGDIDINC